MFIISLSSFLVFADLAQIRFQFQNCERALNRQIRLILSKILSLRCLYNEAVSRNAQRRIRALFVFASPNSSSSSKQILKTAIQNGFDQENELLNQITTLIIEQQTIRRDMQQLHSNAINGF
jgi:hypothetical protein